MSDLLGTVVMCLIVVAWSYSIGFDRRSKWQEKLMDWRMDVIRRQQEDLEKLVKRNRRLRRRLWKGFE